MLGIICLVTGIAAIRPITGMLTEPKQENIFVGTKMLAKQPTTEL